MSADTHRPGGSGGAYEVRDVAFRPVLLAGAAIVALIVGSFVLMYVLDRTLVAREIAASPPASPLARSYGRQEPPAPRLQDAPLRELAELRERERAVLEGWAWVDPAAGRVRIPVERAMELLVAEGRK
jgi:hypothetical protein